MKSEREYFDCNMMLHANHILKEKTQKDTFMII